jgi:hypothetical protein
MKELNGLTGHVDVQIKGQEARPKWERKLLSEALTNGHGASNELRFACRIAQDADAAFEEIELEDGTKLTLNPKGKAQFGRNKQGQPFLTVGVIWSGNGQSYRLQWVGDKVPLKMQQVAVAHDEGRKVSSTRVRLKLDAASFTPVRHDTKADGTLLPRPKRAYRKLSERGPGRTFARLCAEDLA